MLDLLYDRYEKSDFFSSDFISLLSCFRGISAKLSKQYYLKLPDNFFICYSYSGWVFSGLFRDRIAKPPPVPASPLPKICHTYATMMTLSRVILWLYLDLLTSVFFHQKSATLVIWRNTDIDCILIHNC